MRNVNELPIVDLLPTVRKPVPKVLLVEFRMIV
jgi:hypothetical protein